MSPQLAFYHRNKERIKENKKKYRDANRDKIRKAERERQKNKRKAEPEKFILAAAKSRAKREGLPFNLELLDIVIPKFCPILGCELRFNHDGKTASNTSPSLDKIQPELGYVKGNVKIISYKANRLKSDLTIGQIQRMWEYVNGQS